MDTATTLPDILLSQTSKVIAVNMGLSFPQDRWMDLARGMSLVAKDLGYMDAESCMRVLTSSPLTEKQIQAMANRLVVGETYFFRDKKGFEALQEEVLPLLIDFRRRTGKKLTIWSAGCATGEEAYSIAILVDRLLGDSQEWKITILATDINPFFLEKARAGIYDEWSFRDTPTWARSNYFKRSDKQWEILPRLRQMVEFSYFNLVRDPYQVCLYNFNEISLILCRNMLMYFVPEKAEEVVQNLYHSLSDTGWLLVSPSELSQTFFLQFLPVNYSGAIFYRKGNAREGFVKEPCIEDQASGVFAETVLELAAREKEEIAKDVLPRAGNREHEKAMDMARTLAGEGKHNEALKLCDSLIGQDRLNPFAYFLRANILHEKASFTGAMKALRQTLYLAPNHILAHFALGNLELRQGRRAESERHFKNALRLLRKMKPEEVLPDSEGMRAGMLSEMILAISQKRKLK